MKKRGRLKFCIVEYEDGDQEDMSLDDCREAVEYYNSLESGTINEWEVGDE